MIHNVYVSLSNMPTQGIQGIWPILLIIDAVTDAPVNASVHI